MTEQRGFIDNSPAPDKCESLWGGNECPNAPAFLIVTISRPGFAIMCEPHKDGFLQFNKGGDYRVEPYSIGRAKELQSEVDAAFNSSTKRKTK